MYWFIPAFAKSRVGSERGTTDEDGTLRLNNTSLSKGTWLELYLLLLRLFRQPKNAYQTYDHFSGNTPETFAAHAAQTIHEAMAVEDLYYPLCEIVSKL